MKTSQFVISLKKLVFEKQKVSQIYKFSKIMYQLSFTLAGMDISELPTRVCDCLPACNEIQYGQDHSSGDISNPDLRRGFATTIDP